MVTSEQPRSPMKPGEPEGTGGPGGVGGREGVGGGGHTTALEAAEQQMMLIHDEYKKLLREKEVQHNLTALQSCMNYMYMYVVHSKNRTIMILLTFVSILLERLNSTLQMCMCVYTYCACFRLKYHI